MNNINILETERLILKRPSPDEIKEYFRAANNPLILDMHLGVDYPLDMEDAKKRLAKLPEMEEKGLGYYWCIYLKENNEIIGAVSLIQLNKKHKTAELSYWLSDKHWNKGIMTEAAQVITDWGFENLDLERLYGM